MAAAKLIFGFGNVTAGVTIHQGMNRCLCIFLMSAACLARSETAADKLTTAGIAEFTAAYEAWDSVRFATAAAAFRQASTNATATATNFYWLGAAEFHRMLQLQNAPGAATNQAAAAAALESAMAALTAALKLDERHAESHALLGTLYGMKIGDSLLRGVRFGPRVKKHQSAALNSGGDNPRVQYLLGMGQFHTAKRPSAWREALTTLLTAEELFEAEAKTVVAPLAPRWGHDSCLTFIGRTYELLGQKAEAEEYFRKALTIHPADHLAKAGLARVTGKK
jgi:tetratricopeptide (TPR) repeat protein